MQKLRIRYAKRGRMRFTSTRDFQRALERAVRRAGLPMAFSGGFHPHPRISYANAAPTGAASEAEYVEISLNRQVDPVGVAPALGASLPEGLDVLEVVDVTAETGALADRLQGSLWALRFRTGDAAPEVLAAVPDLVAGLLARDELLVERMMKKGLRELDVRAALLDLTVSEEPVPGAEGAPGDVVVLAALLHTIPTVRPEEVWTALRQVGGPDLALPRPVSTRLRQGPVRDAAVLDTLDEQAV